MTSSRLLVKIDGGYRLDKVDAVEQAGAGKRRQQSR